MENKKSMKISIYKTLSNKQTDLSFKHFKSNTNPSLSLVKPSNSNPSLSLVKPMSSMSLSQLLMFLMMMMALVESRNMASPKLDFCRMMMTISWFRRGVPKTVEILSTRNDHQAHDAFHEFKKKVEAYM